MATKQKRFRKILVCTSCHRRKSKCDRQLPCSACIRSGIEDACSYGQDNKRITNILDGDSKISVDELRALIRKVDGIKDSILKDNTTPSFNKNSDHNLPDAADMYNLRRALNTNKLGEYKVVLNWKGCMKILAMAHADPAASLIHKYIFKMRVFELHETAIFRGGFQLTGENMESLEQRCITYFGSKIISKLPNHPSPNDVFNVQSSVSNYGAKYGLSFTENTSWRSEPILMQVRRFLPSFASISCIVNIYFENHLLGSDLILQENLKTEMKKLYVFNEVDGNLQDITINSKLDLATIAILLLIVRITYLSLINPLVSSGDRNPSLEYFSYFNNYTVPLDIPELADQLLNRMNFESDLHINVFQALALQFVYKLCAPEEESFNETNDPGICFSRVASMAKSLNLNQDVIYSISWGENKVKSTTSNYCRRVWIQLNSLAVFTCAFFSNTLEITSQDSDLLLPQIESDSNDNDKSMIKAVIDIAPMVKQAQDICEKTFQLNGSIPTEELIEMLNNLDHLIENYFGNIVDYFEPVKDNASAKLYKFILWIQLKCFILLYYYSFYVYYDTKGKPDLSSCYARKMTKITCVDFSGFQESVLPVCEEYFGLGSWLPLTSIFSTLNRLQLTSVRIRVRYTCSIIYMTRFSLNEEKLTMMKSILLKLYNREKSCLKFLREIGKYQASAWWWFKACSFGTIMVENMQREPDFDFPDDVCLKYSIYELQKWDSCLEQAEKMSEEYKAKLKRFVIEEPLSNNLEQLIHLKQMDGMWQALKYLRKYYHDMCFELSVTGNIGGVPFESGFEFDLGKFFPEWSHL